MPKTRPKPQARRPVKPEGQISFRDLVIRLGLVVAIFVIYAQVSHFDFINYDDPQDVYENIHVTTGLTPENIRWAFTAVVSANWMPVTLLSHMLDCQLFGMASGLHHLVNVLLHALSAVLLFMLMQRATRTRWRSALVAALFAVHPLHVGSVAWITERKDVLSTFFWFLALYCYVRYTERRGEGRYFAMAAAFCLGLMCKPMLVTFPFTVLLFDFWPLGRMRERAQWPRLIWEKLPLFALSAGAVAVTYWAQGSARAAVSIPLATRIENALISYVVYIGQMFRPIRLAVFYPYPESIAAWQPAIALAILAGISAVVVAAWRTRPYLTMGWLWYLGTLVPVIGLVQVGSQAHADRYMYVPMAGLSVMLAWGAAEVIERRPRTQPAVVSAAAACCVVLMALAWNETSYWQNSETLFTRVLTVTGDSWLPQYNLAHYFMKAPGRAADAIPHFKAALRIKPDDVDTYDNLGFCLMKLGRPLEAVPYYEKVVSLKPGSAAAESNLGHALSGTPGRDADAIPHFEAALRLQPDNVETNNDLGACLLNSGRAAEAIPHFEAALRLQPDSADAHFNLALALSQTPGRVAEAIPQYEAALRLKPGYQAAQQNLARLRGRLGRTRNAGSR